tara:strand:+ start:1615 stop:2646 length:1032 start_codon:yes stop_codon:yes gene_type:complete
MNNPKVTVLMSVYNGERYLREAIDSILNQTFTDYEFIIVNDGCTDSSRDIITTYSDRRICLIDNERNIGLTKSLNKGLKKANGEYIARIDADDISLPQRLEKQVTFMRKNPKVSVCGGWVIYFGTKKENIIKLPSEANEIKASLFYKNELYHTTVIFRRELQNKEKVFYNEDYLRAQDYELWSRLSHSSKLRNINEVLAKYRTHRNTVFKTDEEGQLRDANRVRITQLKKLIFEPTKDEIKLHLSLLNQEEIYSLGNIDKIEYWLIKLLKHNDKRKVFNKYLFDNLITKYWFFACNNSTVNGPEVINVYYSNMKLKGRNISIINIIKFVIKSLIKYKPVKLIT